MLEWDCIRFEEAFSAFKKRAMISELKASIAGQVNAMYANSAWDEAEGGASDRSDAIASMHNKLADVAEYIYDGTGPIAEEQLNEKAAKEDLDTNPFFQAGLKNTKPSDKINYTS